MTIHDIIKRRRSVRTFKDQVIKTSDLNQINECIESAKTLQAPFNHNINIFILDLKDGEKPGTYGIIKNPQMYIGGACVNTEDAMVDFGYVFEKLILDLTELEIGTCWLAGTFKRNSILSQVELGPLEILPAISPIGYYEDKRAFESVMRKLVKADNRLPFEDMFFYKDFQTPMNLETFDVIKEALIAVRRGPSASNKQPWRIVFNEALNRCYFYASYTPKYSKGLGFEVQNIDIGIAMYHFEASLKAYNISGRWVKEAENFDMPETSNHYICTFEMEGQLTNKEVL